MVTLDKEHTIVEHINPVTSATNLTHFQKYLTHLTQSVSESVADFLAARARRQSDDNDDEENDDDDDNNETSGRHSREQ